MKRLAIPALALSLALCLAACFALVGCSSGASPNGKAVATVEKAVEALNDADMDALGDCLDPTTKALVDMSTNTVAQITGQASESADDMIETALGMLGVDKQDLKLPDGLDVPSDLVSYKVELASAEERLDGSTVYVDATLKVEGTAAGQTQSTTLDHSFKMMVDTDGSYKITFMPI